MRTRFGVLFAMTLLAALTLAAGTDRLGRAVQLHDQRQGVQVAVVIATRGEGSTLGADLHGDELGQVRTAELKCAIHPPPIGTSVLSAVFFGSLGRSEAAD